MGMDTTALLAALMKAKGHAKHGMAMSMKKKYLDPPDDSATPGPDLPGSLGADGPDGPTDGDPTSDLSALPDDAAPDVSPDDPKSMDDDKLKQILALLAASKGQ